MVDSGSAAVFFSVFLFWTHVVIPVSTVVGAVVALRTSKSGLRWRGVATVAAWVGVPWLVCLATLVGIGFEPLHAFVHVQPFNGVLPKVALGGAAVVAVIVAVRVESALRRDGPQA